MVTIKGPIKLGKGSSDEDLAKLSKAIGKKITRYGQEIEVKKE
jgi:hypothetical protein